MTRSQLIARHLRRWHKRLGLVIAVFIGFLSLTGIAINHGEALSLASTEIEAPWLMGWYGLKPVLPEQGFALPSLLFCAQGGTWVLGDKRLPPGHGDPVGAVDNDALIWLATADQILIVDAAGRPVDTITRDLLPATPIRRIGRHGREVAVIAGGNVHVSDDGISWRKLAGEDSVQWSRPVALSAAQQQQLAPFFAPALPLQRIVADLHSGRIFGTYGPLVTDLLAVVLLLLATSGGWLYLGEKARKNRHHPRPPQQQP